ncbi:MAG: NAD+ synthase [Candidatus Omnitrophota bacterium]|nr:MAG: NAD+ synthase [Candidatus Omnitrophota bacterium]
MKNQRLRIALAQINSTVGDLEANSRKILQYTQRALSFGVDIICFPELALCGYPPEDLLLKPGFIKDNLKSIERLSNNIDKDIVVIAGFVDRIDNKIFNSAAVIYGSKIIAKYHKILLPNYGVFDEKRYFEQGNNASVYSFKDIKFGINICEDLWMEDGPIKKQSSGGAKLILSINSSPYHAGKNKERQALISRQAQKHKVFIAYTNMVGGQDELVFDGQSMIVDMQGKVVCRTHAFREDLLLSDLDIPVAKKRCAVLINTNDSQKKPLPKPEYKKLNIEDEIYEALVLGLRDYVWKNGFKSVVIGLSGGIDSALVATIAADALGSQNVFCVFMSTRYSSKESEEDASQLAKNLGIKMINLSIEQIYKMYLLVLEPLFAGSTRDVTEENLQARIRGNILMALSNKFGWLVLTTGNKSEMSTGYATLYGDMAGGLAVIKDVPKTYVYRLAEKRNSHGFVIPERIFTKAPSAELKPNQKDEDSLPPYDVLDAILKAYVEQDLNLPGMVKLGFKEGMVRKVLNMVDRSEYKRRQSPPGIKITPKAFGRDRRMPITSRYRG